MNRVIERAIRWRHVGMVPLCVPIGSADVGEAILVDGRHVYITWGRNIVGEEIVPRDVHFDLVALGSWPDANMEFLLPAGDHLDRLLSILIRTPESGWNDV